MKKIIISIFLMTVMAITYVSQQTRLIEYSYAINEQKQNLCLLIDQNRFLRYNISKLERPQRLESSILSQKEVEAYTPLNYCVIKIEKDLSVHQEVVAGQGLFAGLNNNLLGMFSLDSEAIAKEAGR
ncbi:hypothetical protein ACFL0T_02350 [Candidatus Omnitrophota bacterium]